MSHKITERRRAAFFAALEACGNVTLAAERVRVSRAWIYLHRANDPEFRAACDAAIAVAAARKADGVQPAPRWRSVDGVELTIRAGNGRRAVLSRARAHGWSPAREHEFIAELARHGNVRAACRHVGLSIASAYAHRQRWPAFFARWERAVDNAEDILVEEVVSATFFRDTPDDLDRPLPQMNAEQVMIALGMFQARRRTAKRPGFHKVREMGLDRIPGANGR